MKVILLKTVPKIGKKDQVVEVSQGYAANALFPQKLAIPATTAAIATVERKHQNIATEKKIQHDLLDRAIVMVQGGSFVYKTKANEKGSLFSKIDTTDICKALLDQYRISIDPKLLTIKNGPIKTVGDYQVDVVEGDYRSVFSVTVEA